MSKIQGLFIGLNYANTLSRLKGCINDVMNMSQFLTQRTSMECEVITDESHPMDATYQGILNRLTRFVNKCNRLKAEFVWIHYSGHGSYIRDMNGDEKDGCDECIVPSDYNTRSGISKSPRFIIDDQIYTILQGFNNPKCTVICVFDSCNSGTVCDLGFTWSQQGRLLGRTGRGRLTPKVLSISGCMDNQLSYDTESGGMLTVTLIQALERSISGSHDQQEVLRQLVLQLTTIKVFSMIRQMQSTIDRMLASQGRQTVTYCSSFALS